MKRNLNKMYLLNTDIEALHTRFEELYKQVKTSKNLSIEQTNRECEILLLKYNFEIEELNALREVEYKTQQAKIKARNKQEIPWRRCCLWRLLFQPLTNRAQDIIEREAAQNAEKLFSPMEKNILARACEIYNLDIKKLSRHKRKKLLKKYLKQKHLLEATMREADETPHSEVFDQPEPPENILEAERAIPTTSENTPPSEPVQAPEEPKRRRKRKKVAETPIEQPAETRAPTVAGQLPGQMSIENLSANK